MSADILSIADKCLCGKMVRYSSFCDCGLKYTLMQDKDNNLSVLEPVRSVPIEWVLNVHVRDFQGKKTNTEVYIKGRLLAIMDQFGKAHVQVPETYPSPHTLCDVEQILGIKPIEDREPTDTDPWYSHVTVKGYRPDPNYVNVFGCWVTRDKAHLVTRNFVTILQETSECFEESLTS